MDKGSERVKYYLFLDSAFAKRNERKLRRIKKNCMIGGKEKIRVDYNIGIFPHISE